ncbi:flagellar assembly protein FliX [Rhodospirillum centenum]|uniref:Flagellar assembly protein FliX n=1 Tax=Rhodospirillum centenum (strain ATCC 51521 / SW) TaxID=414684 RepID=B6IT38_RHOCS|nr:flagellar assembly protein FliX [Rhodospirillum centenum]ACI98796.1 flagellar assembly protein FliX [Rhodospirillum centenum SW]
MKIEGPGSLRPGQVGKARRTGSGGSDFLRELQEGEGSAAPVGGAQTAAAVNPLFALQEVEDATTGRRKAKQRAETILDKLDELRLGLLSGTYPRERLLQLIQAVQEQRAQVDDPRLQQVLDEIDLRAQVEIAKLSTGG